MTTHEHRLWVGVATVLAVALLTVGVAGAVAQQDLHEERREAEGEAAVAHGDLDALATELAHRSAALDATKRARTTALDETEARNIELYVTVVEIVATVEERDEAALAQFLKTLELNDAIAEFERTGAEVGLQGGQIDALLDCLGGVRRAIDALAYDNHAGAVAELQAVLPACRQAEESLSDGAPVNFPFDFPDPFVLAAEGAYWGYSTNGASGDVQLIRSYDLVNWEYVGSALSSLPGWAVPNFTWAPSVLSWGGSYVMYYTAHSDATKRPCISVAVASSPAGPFIDASGGPLICQSDLNGAIDPSPFVDANGVPYLLWKGEGDTIGGVASIFSQELDANATGLVGEPSQLVQADQPWEEGIIEGPSMTLDGTYYLFFSGSRWNTDRYGIGYATCQSPTGPCSSTSGRILGAGGGLVAPGGPEVFWAGGQRQLAYHAFVAGRVGLGERRVLQTTPLRFANGAPVIG